MDEEPRPVSSRAFLIGTLFTAFLIGVGVGFGMIKIAFGIIALAIGALIVGVIVAVSE